ncbi:MAG TPA: nickel pincer cofactor biosynthesis protein LarC [Phycisphaerae bacterium]|nr:nickel pincer cofactor biosynthesis protein LarC [Phycisphaerae bacterium]
MPIAYLDLPSGISGDMFLGCLIDAGFAVEALRAAIGALKLPGEEYRIEARTVMKGPLRATLADIQTSEAHAHRHLADIAGMIGGADLPERVKRDAIATFERLARAEAKVHDTTPDRIHFHEVGAMDAIIDIVGSCAGVDHLGIEKVFASPLPLSAGWTKSEHGQIPLPAPATLELLAEARAPTRPGPAAGEWVTPTGAALVCQLATFGQPAMTLERIGTGAGRKDPGWPNIARLWVGAAAGGGGPAGKLVQLETNIDDMNPQLYAAVSEKLFAAGAKDVWFTPIHMKKNRPAVLLAALGNAAQEEALAQVMLEETTTLGVRVHGIEHRHEAGRAMVTLETRHGRIRGKVKVHNGRPAAITPEYDDVAALAGRLHVPVKEVLDAASAAAHRHLEGLRASEGGGGASAHP